MGLIGGGGIPLGGGGGYAGGQQVLPPTGGGLRLPSGPKVTGGTIFGYVFNDLNNNGIWDATEQAMPNWGVYVDADHDLIHESNEQMSITDANGRYSLTVTENGTFYIGEVSKGWMGWHETLPSEKMTDGEYKITFNGSQSLLPVNFGDWQHQNPGVPYSNICAAETTDNPYLYVQAYENWWDTHMGWSVLFGIDDFNWNGMLDDGDCTILAGK